MAGDARVIDDIYSVVADPARWPNLLTTVADRIGAPGGMVAYVNLGRHESVMDVGRLSPAFVKLYQKRYIANPWNKAMQGLPPNRQVVLMSSLVPFSALSRTAFYADVLAPGRIVDGMSILLPSLAIDGGFGGLHFSIQRRRAERAAESAQRLGRLAPHLCRALEASVKLAPLMLGSKQLECIIGLLPSAALLIDGERRVRFANAAAERLFVGRDGLALDRDGRLQAASPYPAEVARFVQTLTDALNVDPGGDRRIGDPVRISRLSGAGSLLVVPVPLPPPAFELWKAVERARALVLVLDPKAPEKGMMKGLQSAVGLTAGEARVASLIGAGLSGPQAAKVLGVSPATVKTHLAHCFQKTGVHSQVGLARFLSVLPPVD